MAQSNVVEVKVKCPKCGHMNHFYPPRTAELLDSKCINCDESLRMVLYDFQLPRHSQPDTQSEDRIMSDLDIEEVD